MSEHHSADVRITLHLAGEDLAVSHLGPDYLRLPTQAQRWPVRLPDGIHEGKVRIKA